MIFSNFIAWCISVFIAGNIIRIILIIIQINSTKIVDLMDKHFKSFTNWLCDGSKLKMVMFVIIPLIFFTVLQILLTIECRHLIANIFHV